MTIAVLAVLYLGASGARMPLLALRGLTRPRNLVVLLVPFAAMTGASYVIGTVSDRDTYTAAVAIALVPAPLLAPDVVTRLRGRMDLSGALVLGTVLLSLVFVGGQGAMAAGALFGAVEAYALPAMIANAVPMVRDALLVPITLTARIAFATMLILAALAGTAVDPGTIAAALALVVAGTVGSAIAAIATGREVVASVAGAGLRDPALAIMLTSLMGGNVGLALVYGSAVVVLGGIALALRR